MWTTTPSSTVDLAAALGPLASEWRELADRVGSSPFLYPEWFDAWWSAFGTGTLRALTVRRGGRLVGVAPVQLRHGVWRAPANPHTPLFDVVALDEEAVQALAAALVSRAPREIAVGPLDAQGALLGALEAAARTSACRVVLRPAGRAPYLSLPGAVGVHERALSRNLRHDVQRRMRRLCEAGSVSVEVSDGSTALHELLDEGFRVEQRSWKGRQETAIASNRPTLRFYTALAEWAASSGWLRLAFLRLDGRAIAFQFDLEVHHAYYSLKIGYDPAYDRFSPGKLLAYSMVARAVARGHLVYELLGTDEPWKERWTHEGHDLVTLRAFAPSVSGRVAFRAFVYGRPVLRRLPDRLRRLIVRR